MRFGNWYFASCGCLCHDDKKIAYCIDLWGGFGISSRRWPDGEDVDKVVEELYWCCIKEKKVTARDREDLKLAVRIFMERAYKNRALKALRNHEKYAMYPDFLPEDIGGIARGDMLKYGLTCQEVNAFASMGDAARNARVWGKAAMKAWEKMFPDDQEFLENSFLAEEVRAIERDFSEYL